MADLNDTLLAVRYAGIPHLPDTGDAGDRHVQQALEREMTGKRVAATRLDDNDGYGSVALLWPLSPRWR